jgi:sarcosine oxidase delta subunit
MARVYQQPRAKATATCSYGFICEHCGKRTEKQTRITGDEIDSNADSPEKSDDTSIYIPLLKNGAIAEQDLNRLQAAAIKKLNTDFEKIKVNAAKDRFDALYFDGKCPFCGKRQSWEIKGTRSWPIKTAIAGGVIPAVVLAMVGLVARLFSDSFALLDTLMHSPVCWMAIGACAVLGFAVGAYRAVRVRADMKQVSIRQKPQIIWPDPSLFEVEFENIHVRNY